MAKLDFPDASYSPWVAPNNVIYTYIGTSPNGYWEANTANAATNLTAVFVERTGSTMTGPLISGLSGAGYGYQLNNGNTNLGGLYKDTGSSRLILGDGSTTKIDLQGSSGSATFAGVGTFSGDLRVQDGGNFRVRTASNAGQDAILLQNNGNITASGGGTFASRVDVGGLTVDSNLTPSSGTSVEHFYSSTGGVIQAFDRDNGNLEPLRVRGSTWDLALDGSATFAGDIIVGNGGFASQDKTGLYLAATAGFCNVYHSASTSGNFLAFTKYDATASGNFTTKAQITDSGDATFAGSIECILNSTYKTTIGSNGSIALYGAGGLSTYLDNDGSAAFGRGGQISIAGSSSSSVFEQLSDTDYPLALHSGYGNKRGLGIFYADTGAGSSGEPYILCTNQTGTKFQVTSNGGATLAADASINGLTVGKGPGNISTNTTVGYYAFNNNTSGSGNTVIGYYSLHSNTSGTLNTALGYQTLYSNTTGVENTSIGVNSLVFNTTGIQNTATGYRTLYNNTTGSYNTAAGKDTLFYNTTGTNNTGVGYVALHSNTTTHNNTGVGSAALYSNTNGGDNTATGYGALYSNTAGSSNVALGSSALYSNTTSSSNVAIGRDALRLNTTGSTNVAVGREALYSNTTGSYNTACGHQVMNYNTTGNNNSAFGYKALANNTTANQNTAVGYEALRYTTTGGNNVAIGLHAMYGNNTGYENVAVGVNALISNSTGAWNTALGYKALEANTTANHNTAVGRNALISNTGSINTALGSGAMYGNTVGNYNTAVGYGVLSTSTSGDRNVAMGYQAMFTNIDGGYSTILGMYANYYNTNGLGNAACGYSSLHYNTTGNYNTAIGYQSIHKNTTGHRNAAIGINSLYNNTTGAYNVALGRESLFNCTTGSGNIGIGSSNSSGTVTPTFNVSTQNNRLVLGHTSITNAYVQVSWTVTSDERDKMNFAPVPYGLDFINQLKPTAYQFKVDRDTETPNGDVRYGFKAQDILALEGDNPVIIDVEDPDHLKYKGEHLVPVLVNAVQELTTMVKELQAEIKTLKG